MEQLAMVVPDLTGTQNSLLTTRLNCLPTHYFVIRNSCAFSKALPGVDSVFCFCVFNHLTILLCVNTLLGQRLQSASQVCSLCPGLMTTSHTQTGNGGQTSHQPSRGAQVHGGGGFQGRVTFRDKNGKSQRTPASRSCCTLCQWVCAHHN